MNRVICVYDNTIKPNLFIQSVIGEKTFGEVTLKRRSVKEKFQEIIQANTFIEEVIEFDHIWNLESVLQRLQSIKGDFKIVHFFSCFVVTDVEQAYLTFEKAKFVRKNMVVLQNESPVLFMMPNSAEYVRFIQDNYPELGTLKSYCRFDVMESIAFCNISIHANFLQYIAGGFDARFFNSVQGDEFTVTKSSKDIKKIKAEFTFYQLIPEDMKTWFVMPYHYQEFEDHACYTMERYNMTDLAIRWVHGAIDTQECANLLHKVFHFINIRKKRTVNAPDGKKIADALYLEKLDMRVQNLKIHPGYPKIAALLESGTSYASIDLLVSRYKNLYQKLSPLRGPIAFSVIGHGDLCFSNMLFNKETALIKLIDPKGALEDAQLWTDSYYDVAKLSHSICGRYDFFNNALHRISIDADLQFCLEIDFNNNTFIEIFKDFCKNNGFEYQLVRLYEASLFLSMLPLHMDNPQKVFGFILNAINILDEVERC